MILAELSRHQGQSLKAFLAAVGNSEDQSLTLPIRNSTDRRVAFHSIALVQIHYCHLTGLKAGNNNE